MIPIFSFDDFNPDNIKLAELIKKYGLEKETVFFIECISADAQEQIKKLNEAGFMIGSHTLTHKYLSKIPLEDAKWELKGSKEIIEKITGKKIDAFCYPRGRFNDEVKRLVKDTGYKWARTTRVFNIETPKDYFETDTTLHLSYQRKEYKGKDVWEMAKKYYLWYNKGEIDFCHFWAHQEELKRFFLHERFEELLKFIRGVK